ncbi:putative stress response RCI peptide [Choanephora cucurbitarum]|nr:putative stress response RCI peptide [Choanephora cucurbitarum]
MIGLCCLILIIILLPPLGVFFMRGCGADFWINICLTILGYLPGHIHAFYVLVKERDEGRFREPAYVSNQGQYGAVPPQ